MSRYSWLLLVSAILDALPRDSVAMTLGFAGLFVFHVLLFVNSVETVDDSPAEVAFADVTRARELPQ